MRIAIIMLYNDLLSYDSLTVANIWMSSLDLDNQFYKDFTFWHPQLVL